MLLEQLITEAAGQCIIEAKQVGIIYHFTMLSAIPKIIADNFVLTSRRGYISFSREPNPWFMKNEVRITIDGDKLSHHHAITPYADFPNKRFEAEERIKKPSVDISDAIIRIDINEPRTTHEHTTVAAVTKLLQELDIPSSVVSGFRRFRK